MSYHSRYSNLCEILQRGVERFGHKPLFGTRTAAGWQWTTYGEFAELVHQAAGGLTALGVGEGDRVACISNNRLEWAVCAHATYALRAAYVPMYEAQLEEDWRFILNDCGAKVCLTANEGIRYRIDRMQKDLPELAHVLCFEGGGYSELLASGKAAPVTLCDPKRDDLASIIYTSGTTGQPKGVCLTHYNVAANVSAILDVAPLVGEERALSFLPWAHVFGGAVELNAMLGYGAAVAICDDTRKLLDYLPEVQPTLMFAVPRIWNRVYDGVNKQIAAKPKPIQRLFARAMKAKSKRKRGQPLNIKDRIAIPLADKLILSKVVARFGGKLRFAFSGAAALSTEVAEFIDNLGIQVHEGYGMTESSGGTTANAPNRRIGSVGRPLPGMEVRIDKDAPGTTGDEGEIIIYGTGVMAGYYKREEETRAVMTEDGGLRSGDLGFVDDEGFVHITGRVKELFKLTNGKYVAPAPLEESIQLSPYIAQCVVYGSDQPYNVALIVPDVAALAEWTKEQGLTTRPDALVDLPQVRTLLREEIERASRDFKGFETVRDFIVDTEELTPDNGMLTPTLKVKRRNVMAKYEPQLQALYQQHAVA
ncbi:MAG: long-chain fatty acid--CoA ligase [Myxococcales bacterium]|nr:long-chain fatty acid--CoA ligase [Myxococcales bacterium]